jgi:UPF0271 protein
MTTTPRAPSRGAIDLNADLAEGYGRWSFGTDDDLLAVVSSANVACGAHAGDPTVIRNAVATAARRAVTVGAHVGYPDLQGFGRRSMDIAASELMDLVIFQLSALSGIARLEGTTVRYVKPHGALYNRVVIDEGQAAAVAEAIAAFDPGLAVLSLNGSALRRASQQHGLRVLDEAFADRAYLPSGELAPRSMPGAVMHEPDRVTERVLRMVLDNEVVAIDGTVIEIAVDSVCVHGDSPGAVKLARHVAQALVREGVALASPLTEASTR